MKLPKIIHKVKGAYDEMKDGFRVFGGRLKFITLRDKDGKRVPGIQFKKRF